MIQCKQCKEYKNEAEFNFIGVSKELRWDICKECTRENKNQKQKEQRIMIRKLLSERDFFKKKIIELQLKIKQLESPSPPLAE